MGGDSIAGNRLKETGTYHWEKEAPILFRISTNESGFTALPGGYRTGKGHFREIGEFGYWWTSTEGSDSGNLAWHQHV